MGRLDNDGQVRADVSPVWNLNLQMYDVIKITWLLWNTNTKAAPAAVIPHVNNVPNKVWKTALYPANIVEKSKQEAKSDFISKKQKSFKREATINPPPPHKCKYTKKE